ncbi:hypothetical protein TSAR_015410 [Trichomalopsis sarcophagae]|uniref:Reverse transcriptase n=1 Tax=Trichomalopsis sarcophagae TaxID=543379 RepID=A0A232FCZ5_9HYME|nr:hypothetical protein TSAR_015410 [Trichomalopsis sarcophagae]
MPNIGGPKQPRRSLLASIVNSVILYGAPIWADALTRNASFGAPCRRACRVAALRVARAYRTVSDVALSAIAGLPPIDLLASERAEKYREASRTEGEKQDSLGSRWAVNTYRQWQQRWDSASEGRWTHRIIPDISRWSSRKHGFTTFHLTQVLTGHGCFRSYLYRIKTPKSIF